MSNPTPAAMLGDECRQLRAENKRLTTENKRLTMMLAEYVRLDNAGKIPLEPVGGPVSGSLGRE